MLRILKKTLKKLKGKGAARIFAAAVVSSLLLESSLGVSFASEGTDENIFIGSEPSAGAGEEVYIEGGQELPEGEEFFEEEMNPTEKESAEEEPSEEEENNQTVSGQPENNQAVGGQDVSDPSGNDEDVSGQPEEGMTDAVKEFLAAMDRLLELAANDAPAEEMLAAVEYARGLYEKLTEEEKELPEVALRKEALDSFDSVMPLEEVTVDTEDALRNEVNDETKNLVKLGSNITLSRTLAIHRETDDITLDLNGHELRLEGASGSVIIADLRNQITDAFVTFTLKDSVGGGVITGGNGGPEYPLLNGGGVYCEGNFTMESGTISGNTVTGNGGGVYCRQGNFTMTGGEISGNTANCYYNSYYDYYEYGEGGGVYCDRLYGWSNEELSFTMTGGTISGNTAGIVGSDIYCDDNDRLVRFSTSPTKEWGKVDGTDINGWYYDGGYNFNDPDNIIETDRWSAGNAQIFNRINESFKLLKRRSIERFIPPRSWPLALIAAYGEAPVTPPEPDEPVTPPPAHEHTYTQSKAPACTADGEEKCSCGLTKTLPALGHSYDAGVITKEADCETAGVKTITCSRCNDRKTEEIPPVGHTWNNGTVTTEAECETAGVRTLTCSKCNRTKTEAIPAIGHRWDNGTVTKEPTYEEEGVKTYTCLNNETHKRTEPVAKLGENGGQTNTTNTDNGDKGKKPDDKKTETPEPVITHTPELIPDAGYEYPAYRNETPDANDPETPEIIVVIDENGTPLTYRKIEDPDNPGKMIYVEDSSIPLSASPITEKAGHWALLNLIMTLVSVLGGIYGLIGYIAERNRKEEKRRRWYLAGAAAALLSVIVFVLTQNMRMAMIFADRYTFLMIALALMQTPGFLQRRKEEELA